MVITLSFGSGHVTAARAVASALGRESAGSEVRLVDALENCHPLFRMFYVWSYWAMIRFAPALWKRFFERRVAQRKAGTAPVWAWTFGCRSLFREIESWGPDVIVACEVGACEIGVIARRKGLTRASIVNVITDFEAEPIWVQPEVSSYAAASESVGQQLREWGAPAVAINVVGIPLNEKFRADVNIDDARASFGFDERPVVLLMGGGMGPTNMDLVAKGLLATGNGMQIVALPGKDKRARRRLNYLSGNGDALLRVLDWTDDIAALMKISSVLVTKPGGVTLAEAAVCGRPMVFFDAIPGPEETNARQFVEAGAARLTGSAAETVAVVAGLLQDDSTRKRMAENAAALARPDAAEQIARIAVEAKAEDGAVLIVAISNGAGHTRVANGIAETIRLREPGRQVKVVDVADYMSRIARFTHVTAYLWIVKNAPAIWGQVDRYQKSQESTSPDWFYRRNCRKLFDLARSMRPSAIVATEVGCCEISALIKRDLGLNVPLVAVNSDPDTDKAWVKPEVDLYCFGNASCADELAAHGARRDRIVDWGPVLASGFAGGRDREADRLEVCRNFALDPSRPIVLIAGGGEGIGRIEEITGRLAEARLDTAPQFVVLTGTNERLRDRCLRLINRENADSLCVPGWIDEGQMPRLMGAADLLVSKLGNMFNEAVASELPLIALEPPPGAERLQYNLLAQWNVGRPVKTIDELVETVLRLLNEPGEIEEMRENARIHGRKDASARLADWLSINGRGVHSQPVETETYSGSQISSGLVV